MATSSRRCEVGCSRGGGMGEKMGAGIRADVATAHRFTPSTLSCSACQRLQVPFISFFLFPSNRWLFESTQKVASRSPNRNTRFVMLHSRQKQLPALAGRRRRRWWGSRFDSCLFCVAVKPPNGGVKDGWWEPEVFVPQAGNGFVLPTAGGFHPQKTSVITTSSRHTDSTLVCVCYCWRSHFVWLEHTIRSLHLL